MTLSEIVISRKVMSSSFALAAGGFALLISLLKSADSTLGYTVPELNLPMLNIFPVRLLGTGHNSVVYEALLEQSQLATKHAVKVSLSSTKTMTMTLLPSQVVDDKATSKLRRVKSCHGLHLNADSKFCKICISL